MKPHRTGIFGLILRSLSIIGGGLLFAGCAGVTVTPLDPSGAKLKSVEPGLRYYMPKPYLLVVELPPTAPVASNGKGKKGGTEDLNGETDITTNSVAAGSTKASAKSDTTNSSTDGGSSPASTAPISDTSFMASTPQYMVKLIYLPDLSRPMAMTESTGLFGTSDMKPALQDGWMLTSLDAPADSKVSETLAAVASIVGSAMGGGSSKAASAAKSGTQTQGFQPPPEGESTPIMHPGLYEFHYNASGVLDDLKPVVFFDSNAGAKKPQTPKP